MSKKTTITILALIALLISVSPYIVMIIQIKMFQSTKALPLEKIYLNSGWLISLCLSVLVILKIKNVEFNKKWLKFVIISISGISILLSCLWAFLFLIILPQFPPA